MGFCGSAIRGAVFVLGAGDVAPSARRLYRQRLAGRSRAERAAEPAAVQPAGRWRYVDCATRYVRYIVPAGFVGSGFQQTLSSSGSAELPGMCSKGMNVPGWAERLRTVSP